MNDFLRDRIIVAVGNHYLIDGEIGRGGMAVVYRAVDLRLHRSVAIKVLPPDRAFNADVRARFLREAQTAAQLSHPNIVPIYAVDETEQLVYFVMGLVDGESLAARLAREPRQPAEEVARILREVSSGLDYAHSRGVVHRDIKPDNILIERGTGRAVVTDFGIARAAAESRLTVTGVAVGTPAYMSPEQALGESDVDGRSDIYSLGVVGYQMVAGEPPFRATNTPAMLMKHVSEPPLPLRQRRTDVPPGLAYVVERALAKKPADRWQTAQQMCDALASDLHAAPPVPWIQPAAKAGAHPDQGGQARAFVGLRIGGDGSVEIGRGALPPLNLLPRLPGDPRHMSRHEWKVWRREQKQALREQKQAFKDSIRSHVAGAALAPLNPEDQQARWRNKLERRIMRWRRSIVAAVVGIPAFFLFGVATHSFPLFFFPSAFLALQLLIRTGMLWADGGSMVTALRSDWRTRLFGENAARAAQLPGALPAASPPPPPSPRDEAAKLVPPEILAGIFGQTVIRAVEDRAAVRDVMTKLPAADRELLPDVTATANALADRVASLATMLHRLDADVSGASLAQLDRRIEGLRSEVSTADRDRHLKLLERQRTTLHDLLERRRTLANQLESASLLLQNLKFDLYKLRTAGVGAALEDVTSVTQEARALSRDIGHLLEAADDVRHL